MSTTIYMRPLGRLWALPCQAHMSVALDGNNCYVASFFRSQTASSSHPFAFLPPSPNTSPHTNGGFSPSSSHRTPLHPFILAEQSKTRARVQECSGDHRFLIKEEEFTAIDVAARGSHHPDPPSPP